MRDSFSYGEQYEALVMEVFCFQSEDVICTSGSESETTRDLHGEPHYW